MKRSGLSSAMACAGAVIGAGFASGREIVVFFTQYGHHSWWLIVLSSAVMAALCALCMNAAKRCSCGECWCELFPGRGALTRICSLLLMIITAGAMVSAAGHMIELLCPSEWAYALGAAGTLWVTWLISGRNTRMLEGTSSLLTMMLTAALLAALRMPSEPAVQFNRPSGAANLLSAGLRAAAYAGLNMTLAIGVVCQRASHTRFSWQTAGLFGWMIAAMLLVGNSLYIRHPNLMEEAFPLVRLLGGFGRAGYAVSAVLLYLSIFTTLTAIMVGLRSAARSYLSSDWLQMGLCVGLPVLISCMGFSGIVERFYAPAGLFCLAAVFGPLAAGELRLCRKRTEC